MESPFLDLIEWFTSISVEKGFGLEQPNFGCFSTRFFEEKINRIFLGIQFAILVAHSLYVYFKQVNN